VAKKKSEERGLTRQESSKALTVEQVLDHPVVRELSTQLKAMKQVVDALPELIGRAVKEATRKPPPGASGPPVPLMRKNDGVEFHKGGKVVDPNKA
jgi:hypothetical protein